VAVPRFGRQGVNESVAVEEGAREHDCKTQEQNKEGMFGVLPMDDQEEHANNGNEEYRQPPKARFR
jgi:hypothetical protein